MLRATGVTRRRPTLHVTDRDLGDEPAFVEETCYLLPAPTVQRPWTSPTRTRPSTRRWRRWCYRWSAERRVTLAGRPVQLTAIEYGLLFELSANAGRVMTYNRLLQRVWGLRSSRDSRRVRTAAKQLRRKLGDDANNPTYILNEPRIGYRMPKGEGQAQETS